MIEAIFEAELLRLMHCWYSMGFSLLEYNIKFINASWFITFTFSKKVYNFIYIIFLRIIFSNLLISLILEENLDQANWFHWIFLYIQRSAASSTGSNVDTTGYSKYPFSFVIIFAILQLLSRCLHYTYQLSWLDKSRANTSTNCQLNPFPDNLQMVQVL